MRRQSSGAAGTAKDPFATVPCSLSSTSNPGACGPPKILRGSTTLTASHAGQANSVLGVHLLVLQFPADDVGDYDAMVEIEDLLIDKLDDQDEVDGHDLGQGEMNIFIRTDDARRTFAAVREALADHALMRMLAAGYREEDGNDFTSLWPTGIERFEVL